MADLAWRVEKDLSEKQILDEVYVMIERLARGRKYTLVPTEPDYDGMSVMMQIRVKLIPIHGNLRVVGKEIWIDLECVVMEEAKDYLREELAKSFDKDQAEDQRDE